MVYIKNYPKKQVILFMNINLQPKIEQRKIQYEGIEYLINYADLTAGVIGCNSTKINVKIPRSIIYESNEFIIISILEKAFDSKAIKSIEFEYIVGRSDVFLNLILLLLQLQFLN